MKEIEYLANYIFVRVYSNIVYFLIKLFNHSKLSLNLRKSFQALWKLITSHMCNYAIKKLVKHRKQNCEHSC